MEKSQLNQLIQSFSQQEKREIRRFLASPFFNQRQDVIQLFDLLAGTDGQPEKQLAKRHLFGSEEVKDADLRLRMTYLHRLLEQFIAWKELTINDLDARLHLAAGYRRRGLAPQFERAKKNLEKTMAEQPRRDAHFHQINHRLHWEAHQLTYPKDPTDTSHLLAAARSADVAWLSQKLRLTCLLAAHQSVYQTGYQAVWDEAIVELAEKHLGESDPAVAVYLHCYRLLSRPDEVHHFQNFKKILLQQPDLFSPEELYGLYILAVNYCVRQINAGATAFFAEALDLYKAGLEKDILLENGVLSRYTYFNVAAAALQTGELDWARFFINEYKNRVEKKHRESAFSFNLARLEYASRRYDHVLELLQKANYRDPLLNLAAKTLLLKTWFELDEREALASHLDAMRNYINRKRVLGYHRTNYLNIIRYTEKLLKISVLNKKEAAALRSAIEREEVLTERVWFLENVG